MKPMFYFAKQLHAFGGKRLYANFFAMVLIAVTESLGILMLVPFLHLTGIFSSPQEDVLPIPWLNAFFEGFVIELSLPGVLVLFILLVIGQSFFQRNQLRLHTQIQQGFIRHLRETIYQALVESKWSYLITKRKSDVTNILTTEVVRVLSGTHLLLQFFSLLIFTGIQICFAFWLSPYLTIAVLLCGGLLLLSSRGFTKKSKEIGKDILDISEEYFSTVTDHFNGIKEIKSNLLEETHVNSFRQLCKRIETIGLENMKVKTASQFLFKAVSGILIALFVYYSITMLKAQPTQLMLITIIFSRLWPKITSIQSQLENLVSLIPSFKLLADIQHECKQSRELDYTLQKELQPITLSHSLECRDVFFKYHKDQQPYTLEHVTISVPAFKMTAIVGSSGAGKSTLIDLLMGLNQPESGEVLADGIPLSKENVAALRKSVSYVPQDPFLFNASIRENLQIVKENASENEIWEALEFASAAEFVRKLPQGLDTIIGDRGIRLSGGERQRLVLARAILRKPSILVLDEATSALDSENELKIQQSIERLKGKMTIIVIAHRLSTIRNADQVIVLDKGKVVQAGGYNQLANEKQGVFSGLLKRQMG